MESQTGKCDEKSRQLAVEGDQLLVQGKFFEALASYNKSLCFAEIKSAQLSIALQKRCAVYLQLKRYQKCLESIKIAKNILNLSANDSTFNDFEECCLKNIPSKEEEEENDDDPWKFFKLSYPKHDKIPFIIDCLKPTETWKYGRCVTTTRDLKPGDVVAIEEPYFRMLNRDSRHIRCANCLRFNLMNLIPCPGRCTKCETCQFESNPESVKNILFFVVAMFCSPSCLKSAWLRYHKFECGSLDTSLNNDNEYDMMIFKVVIESLSLCGSLENMQTTLQDLQPNKSLFDFNLNSAKTNDELEKLRFKAICALRKGPTSKEDIAMADWIVESHPALSSVYKSQAKKDFLKTFVIKIMGITDRNSYILSSLSLTAPHVEEETGSGVFPFSSLINHSCSPNLYRLFVDNKQVFIVKKPIEAGQQLFVGYQ